MFGFTGCQGDVVVGLRVSDHSHGQQDHIGGQQHLEQHTHITCRTGETDKWTAANQTTLLNNNTCVGQLGVFHIKAQ